MLPPKHPLPTPLRPCRGCGQGACMPFDGRELCDDCRVARGEPPVYPGRRRRHPDPVTPRVPSRAEHQTRLILALAWIYFAYWVLIPFVRRLLSI